MPTYEYECTSCGQHIEVYQRFSEDALTTCGNCGGTLRKVFHPAGIVFKGSGFYATDSRSKKPPGTGAKKDDGGSKDAKSDGGAKADTKSGSGSADTSSSSTTAKDAS